MQNVRREATQELYTLNQDMHLGHNSACMQNIPEAGIVRSKVGANKCHTCAARHLGHNFMVK